jgi:xanthine dehydrogenase accessory factor
VRAQRPTSARPGDVALVLGDGTIEGFVGGVCAEHSVRVYSLKTIETGEPVLLKILPDAPEGEVADGEGEIIETEAFSTEEGSVTVKNTCLSGGAIEVFLEPVLPAPRVLVVGDAPIAGAMHRLGEELGFEMVAVENGAPEPTYGGGRRRPRTQRAPRAQARPRCGCALRRTRGESQARRRRAR